ncbi:MAG: AMP-binding protein [Opitutaceae bacterium]|nr:AMP-binding protein [Opitutaceae bacterium]
MLGAPAGVAAEPHPGAVLIAEAEPRRFMAALSEAVARDGDVFLCDPNWGDNERAQLADLASPVAPGPREAGWLMIPTGGTSGKLKFARHDGGTLAAAVHGFARHFGLARVNAVGVLPLHHVSGLMAWMRCALTGGEFLPLDWREVAAGARPVLAEKPDGCVISLVPTQLERLLQDEGAVAWLKRFRIIFLGGAPAWPDLLDRAAAQGLPLSLGYGMTETAAMVTALRPGEFLAGRRDCGPALPHATVRIGADDTIVIAGDSLFRGYHPHWRDGGEFETADRGRLNPQGHLHILGRRDAVIITGGEKVEPAEIEALLRGTGQFPDLAVLGLPDARWGQLLVVVYPGNAHPDFHAVIRATNRLADYKRPKSYIPLVGAWPTTASGKLNVAGLVERVIAQLKVRR